MHISKRLSMALYVCALVVSSHNSVTASEPTQRYNGSDGSSDGAKAPATGLSRDGLLILDPANVGGEWTAPPRLHPFVIDQANDAAAPAGGFVVPGGGPVGQEFTPTLQSLDAVELQMNSQSNVMGGTAVVRIRSASITGSILGISESVSLPPYTSPQTHLAHFDFAVPVPLTPGAIHVLEIVATTGSLGVFITGFGANSYPGGAAVFRGDLQPGDDLWFREGLSDDDLDSGLVAYWSFNEGAGNTAYDYSGNANHGLVLGAGWDAGVLGSALSFAGVNEYITVPDNASQQISSGQLTVVAWINLGADVIGTQRRIVCKQQTDGIAWGLQVFGAGYGGSRGNQLVFHDANGSAWYNCLSDTDLSLHQWYHVAVTDSAGRIRMYLDGHPVWSSNIGYGILPNISAPIVIGAKTTPVPQFYWNGLIDEVRLYNRALSQAEIEELYRGAWTCPILMTGDVNVSGSLTFNDIIALVDFVFKGGAAPVPCQAAGDVNCSGAVTMTDVIILVNVVFRGGALPCDVCTIIPGTWSCP